MKDTHTKDLPHKTTEEFTVEERIILRDFLALKRTKLANERTYLSYIKFSLYLITGGISVIGLKDLKEIYDLGIFAIILGVISFLIGTIRFFQLKKQLNTFYEQGKEL